jgi:hypothetical protein
MQHDVPIFTVDSMMIFGQSDRTAFLLCKWLLRSVQVFWKGEKWRVHGKTIRCLGCIHVIVHDHLRMNGAGLLENEKFRDRGSNPDLTNENGI